MPNNRLIVIRLAEMRRVHPDQVQRKCDGCSQLCAIYPSGQQVLRRYPGMEVICSHCHGPTTGEETLAPGAELEPFESVKRQR